MAILVNNLKRAVTEAVGGAAGGGEGAGTQDFGLRPRNHPFLLALNVLDAFRQECGGVTAHEAVLLLFQQGVLCVVEGATDAGVPGGLRPLALTAFFQLRFGLGSQKSDFFFPVHNRLLLPGI